MSVFAFIATLLLGGCGDKSKSLDTPTTGSINICVDESYFPLIDAELKVFHSYYKYANVKAKYVSEKQAFKDLLNDSVRLIIVSRDLTEEERKYFEEMKFFPVTTKIAVGAVALIANLENVDSSIALKQLEMLFKGNFTRKSLNHNSPNNEIKVVFDNANSGIVRFIKENFSQQLPDYCYALAGNAEVIDYVAAHKNASGLIGVNWISDRDDSLSMGFLKRIRVMRIKTDSTDIRGKQPYQAYIANGTYPFTRSIYIISREARNGLGSGFTAFVASDKGQRII